MLFYLTELVVDKERLKFVQRFEHYNCVLDRELSISFSHTHTHTHTHTLSLSLSLSLS